MEDTHTVPGDSTTAEQDWLGDTTTPKQGSPRSEPAQSEPVGHPAAGSTDADAELVSLAFLDSLETTNIMSSERWQQLYNEATKQGTEQDPQNATVQAEAGSTMAPTCTYTSEEALERFLADSQGWQEYMARVDSATDAFATVDPKLLQSPADNNTGPSEESTAATEELTEASEKSKGKQPMRHDIDAEATLAVPPELLAHFANVPGMNYIPCQACYAVAQLGYHTFPNLIDMLIPPHFFLAYSGAQDDHIAMLKPLLSLFKSCIAQSAATYIKAQRTADHDTMQRISGELVNQVRPALTGLRVALKQYFACCFKDSPEVRAVVMTALTDPEIGPHDWISTHHP